MARFWHSKKGKNISLVWREFQERLLGERIKAAEINDDKIGRVMDDLYEVS
jgi:ribosomal protein L18E